LEQTGQVKRILLKNDLNFLTTGRFADFFTSLILIEPKAPDMIDSTWNDRVFFRVTSALDRVLRPRLVSGSAKLPKVIIIDFRNVRIIDITALITIEEAVKHARKLKIAVLLINATGVIAKMFQKFGYENDHLINMIDESAALSYEELAGVIIPYRKTILTKNNSSNNLVMDGNEDDNHSNNSGEANNNENGVAYNSGRPLDEEHGLMRQRLNSNSSHKSEDTSGNYKLIKVSPVPATTTTSSNSSV